MRNRKTISAKSPIFRFDSAVAPGATLGEALGIRNTVVRIRTKRFGAPPPEALAALEAIDSAAALQPLADRLLEVESWQELLGRE